MRLVRVKAPEGKGQEVAKVAFDVGISQVGLNQHQTLKRGGEQTTKDIVDIETATPTAKAFIDALMSASFFDPQEYSITVRQPRAIISHEKPAKITWPLVEPTTDVFEELWQFSHVTYGFIGRILIASMLLAYGLIESNLLLIIAGLLFMPLLPLMLAMGFGLLTRQWRLVVQGGFALTVAGVLAMAGGAAVALMANPPLKYNESSSLLTGFLISLAVGVAAGLATGDDVGRREMIGLAATAQIAIIPVWFGISFVFGFPAFGASPAQRATTFFVNIATIVAASFATYMLLGMRGEGLRKFSTNAAD